MRNVLETLRKLNVTMLVTIGGDDTAFSGSQVYLRAGGAIRVAHVPKTIDNDLPLPGSAPTFGFETARHLGVGIVRNLAEDARTTSRWYLIVSMGRAAGHLALGIGKAAAATLTIIPEEFRGRPVSVDDVCDILIGSIVKRRSANLNYGVAVLAEGLIEAIGEKGLETMIDDGQLGRYGTISRDDHGHLRLGEIDFGRMMKDALTQKLKALGLEITIIDKDLGYELRCADPIPFDAEYTRDLGYGAVNFLMSDESAQVRGDHQPGGRPAEADALRGHDQSGNAANEAAQGGRGRRELPVRAGVHDPAGAARPGGAGAAGPAGRGGQHGAGTVPAALRAGGRRTGESGAMVRLEKMRRTPRAFSRSAAPRMGRKKTEAPPRWDASGNLCLGGGCRSLRGSCDRRGAEPPPEDEITFLEHQARRGG